MTDENPKNDELEQDELDGQTAEELPDREVLSTIEPMNPMAPVGGEVIQPPPSDT
jgi:hypothetical protein